STTVTSSAVQFFFSLYEHCDHRDLHSFPTRRSSDLVGCGLAGLHAAYALSVQLPHEWEQREARVAGRVVQLPEHQDRRTTFSFRDRKSTRLNSSHVKISYAVFCLKKKKLE